MGESSGSPCQPCTPEWSKSLSRELEDVINRQNLLTTRTRRRVLVSLQENSKQEEDSEMITLRKRAIDEIINSEKSYLRHLELVEEYFMNPIRESGFLPNNVYAGIFGDILGIRQVNKELLTSMEHSTEQIGKVFLELAPYLKFYSTYANDFEKATKLVEEWMEKHKGFRALLANQESRPEVQRKLNALLITPVQRIPRYKLLLDDIIKNTPRFHPDRSNLEEARTQIDAIAWHINDQIKEHENNELMINIQKSLQGGLPKLIKPGRKLLRHGKLMKVNKSGGHAQPRYFVLFTDMIMYCKLKGNTTGGGVLELPKNDALEVCCVLPLKHTKVEHVVGKGVFTIQCQKEHLVLYTTNAEDSTWVEHIQAASKLLKKNSATLKRESTKFEPMRKPDILKLRRESLSKIMLMRKAGETKREELKESTKTSSPLLSALSPRKRKPEYRLESPTKLKKIVESPAPETTKGTRTPATPKIKELASSPVVRRTPPRKAKEGLPVAASTPKRKEGPPTKPKPTKPKSPLADENDVELRKQTKTEFKRQPRNSLRSLSLNRAGKLKKEEARPKSIFRSPSIYDDPRPSNIQEDTMSSYLSGRIVPLTPSTRPTNVEHLVRREEDQAAEVIHPVAVPDKKSYCSIS